MTLGPLLPKGVVDLENEVILRTTRNGDIVAIANRHGQKGVVLDAISGQTKLLLNRGDYHNDHSIFSLAFVENDDRTLLIHATAWNRLDVSDVEAAEMLTVRSPTSYKEGEDRPEHYLDYFHCGLLVSPGQQYIADNGWVWAPVGLIATWSISNWLQENLWESEDGPSKKYLCQRDYYWDGPFCWIDDRHLAVWGYGGDDLWLIPAVRIFDVESGEQVRWFPGPQGTLVFDEYLFSWNEEGTSIWEVSSGERLLSDDSLCPMGYHPSSKCFLSVQSEGKICLSRLR